ncbi:MAG: hypothetical protein ACK5KP_07750 [Paludibacteraceae bacterium]
MLLVSTVFLFVQCDTSISESAILENDNFQEQLEREQIIKGFKESVLYFNKNKDEIKGQNVSAVINSNRQRQQYAENLNIINSKTGLNLDYKIIEIDALESNLIDGLNEVYISDEQNLKDIEKIKVDGNYGLYLEVLDILNEVYSNEPMHTNSPQFRIGGWSIAGCGIAVASNFVATIGLGACLSGVGCPLAIAGKILAYGSLVACIGSLA